MVEPTQIVEGGLLDDTAPDDLRERQHRHERPDRMTVARCPLRTKGAARRDQHRRPELERAAHKAADITALLVDDELARR